MFTLSYFRPIRGSPLHLISEFFTSKAIDIDKFLFLVTITCLPLHFLPQVWVESAISPRVLEYFNGKSNLQTTWIIIAARPFLWAQAVFLCCSLEAEMRFRKTYLCLCVFKFIVFYHVSPLLPRILHPHRNHHTVVHVRKHALSFCSSRDGIRLPSLGRVVALPSLLSEMLPTSNT